MRPESTTHENQIRILLVLAGAMAIAGNKDTLIGVSGSISPFHLARSLK